MNVSTSTLIHSYLQVNVAVGLVDSGIAHHLLENSEVAIHTLQQKQNSSELELHSFLDASIGLGLLNKDGDLVSLTPTGTETIRHIGYFRWFHKGYGTLLSNMGGILSGNSPESTKLRNGDQIAQASMEVGKEFMSATVNKIISTLPMNYVADIGCGDASRIIDFAQNNSVLKAIGFDIDDAALSKATQNITSMNISNRVSVSNTNIFTGFAAIHKEVDTVMSFLMLHDAFNFMGPVQAIQRIVQAFPNAKTFIFTDTLLQDCPEIPALDSFSVGFKLVHGILNLQLFTVETYLNAFESSGLTLKIKKELSVPQTYLFVLEKA